MQKSKLQVKNQNLPKGWRKVKLGDVAEINMGQSPRSEFYNTRDEGLPFYQGVTDFGVKYPKKSIYCSQSIKIADTGDIFFSVRAPVGNVNIATEKSCIGRGVAALRMKNKNNDFLYFLLKNYERHFKGISGGTTYESINKDQIENIELLIPENLEVQKRIAGILSAFDDKIELNNKISAVLEQMAQEIFKEWFVKFRFPGHEKVKMVDSELGKIPEGWEVKKLSDIATLDKGISYKGAWLNKSGMPMINLGCFLRGGKFTYDNLKHYSGDYKSRHIAQVGDLLISNTDITQEREIIGNPVIVEEWLGNRKYLFTHHIYILRPKSEMNKIFLYFLLRQSAFRARVFGAASGTNILGLSKEAISSFEVVAPPKELTGQFLIIASQILEKISKIKHENQKLAALRDLILPKLISGEIAV